MKKNIILYFAILSIMQACSDGKRAEEKTVKRETVVTVSANEVRLTAEQIKNAGIVIGTPENREMHRTLKVNGVIDVPPQNIVSISFPLGGYLKNINLLPGMPVRKGAVLARLEDQQFIQLQQDYLTAKSKLQFLEEDYKRQKSLNETKANSDKVFQQVQSDYQSQKVLVNALYEKLRLIGMNPASLNEHTITRSVNIYSPISGYVSKVNVNTGKYVAPTDILFELVNPNDIHLSLTVFEKDIANLSAGQKVVCYTNSKPEQKYIATVSLINRSINNERASEVHCHFESYHKSLLPGMFMNAEIAMDNAPVKAVPSEAVVRWENKFYVFGAEENNRFVMQPVELGNTDAEYTEIKTDSIPQSIVIKNAYSLLMKMKNSSEE